MGFLQLLTLVVTGLKLLSTGMQNVVNWFAYLGKMIGFTLGLWLLVLAAFVVPRTWWRNQIAKLLDWGADNLNWLAAKMYDIPIRNIGSYFEALGEPFQWAAYLFDFNFAFRLVVGLSSLWVAAFMVKALRMALQKAGK